MLYEHSSLSNILITEWGEGTHTIKCLREQIPVVEMVDSQFHLTLDVGN